MSSVSEDRQPSFSPGLAIKQPVRLATTVNVAFVSGAPNGLFVVDGVQTVVGDRVLFKNQTDPTQNGIWEANTGIWTRTPDFDGIRDVANGTMMLVLAGSQGGQLWRVATNDPITPGSTSIAFSSLPIFSAPVPGGVLFGGAGGTVSADSANFFWDDANNRLGIGNAAPTVALDVTGAIKSSSDITIHGISIGLGANAISNNTVVGVGALASGSLSGGTVSAFGFHAAAANTTAHDICAFGSNALAANDIGPGSNAFGSGALKSQITNGLNDAFGNNAGGSITTGFQNSLFGLGAAGLGTDITSFAIFGQQAFQAILHGTANAGCGYQIGNAHTSGDNNSYFGHASGWSNISGSRNVCLGARAGFYATSSDEFYVNNQDRTNTAGDKSGSLLYGVFNATSASQTLRANAKLGVGGAAGGGNGNWQITGYCDSSGSGLSIVGRSSDGIGLLSFFNNDATTQQLKFQSSATSQLIIPSAAGVLDIGQPSGSTGGIKRLYVDFTNTGTVGAVTINKAAGRVNIAGAGTTVVVTNSIVTAASKVFAVLATADATATIKNVVPSAGSFTITLGAAATGQVAIDFFVVNAD